MFYKVTILNLKRVVFLAKITFFYFILLPKINKKKAKANFFFYDKTQNKPLFMRKKSLTQMLYFWRFLKQHKQTIKKQPLFNSLHKKQP